MSERKKSPWLTVAIAVCVVLALMGVYVGAYYAMVHRTEGESITVEAFYGMSREHAYESFADDTVLSGILDLAFAPIHSLDRLIRRSYWEPREYW